MQDRGQQDEHSEAQSTVGEPLIVVPYGGDAAVARSMLAVHVRNPWTGRCRSCGEVFPCPDRQDAEVVLGPQPRPQRMVGLLVALVVTAVVTVAIVVAAVALW